MTRRGKCLLYGALFTAGLACGVVGLPWLGGTGLPYPDPTPELLEHQSRDMMHAGMLVALALVVSAVAAVRLVKAWRQ